jgi:hypothetical protein
MAIESLVVFGLATLVLLAISIYANKHRSRNTMEGSEGDAKE